MLTASKVVYLGRSQISGGKFMANADRASVLIHFPAARTPDVEFFAVLT
ncbi:hypothetical protein [Saccharothrix syringae]|nr:hypothetical protein [Saccharothrix syringae]